jgi:hypothetical protein
MFPSSDFSLSRSVLVPLLLSLSLSACPSSSEPYSDDDDLGDFLDDDDTGPTGDCGTETCEDDQFCRNEVCEDIWGRSFRFTINSASIDETGPTGEAWDPWGGLPDSYAEITWNGELVVETSVIDDTLSPTWGDSETQVLSSGGELCFSVYDSNWPLASDHIDGACREGNDSVVATVRAGGREGDLYDGYATLSLTVAPNF